MSLADKLLNRFNAAAQDWGAATESEGINNRVLIRRRDAYYKAFRELREYVEGLERSIGERDAEDDELSVTIDSLQDRLNIAVAYNQKLELEVFNRTVSSR